MSSDTELLRRFVDHRSEAAFAELVRLHLNLVYFAALRQVGGDTHRAQEVAQSVFTDLARKAPTLTNRTTLTGWLHTSTRFAAAKARRADFSRQQHEQEATTMNALLSEKESYIHWERLRPMIDDAVHELEERDREAVLLRFFENRPFAEIGATLRLSEDAARMRVDRALEKLRAALGRRGVSSTSAALAAAFANQVCATAPAGLAGTITSAALAGRAAGGLAVAGAGLFMSNTSTAIVSVVALAAIGSIFLLWNRAQRTEVELAALAFERDTMRSQLLAEQQRARRFVQDIGALRNEVEMLNAKPVAVPAPPRPAPAPPSEMVAAVEQLRRSSMNHAMMNNLRQISAAVDQFNLRNHRPPTSIQELVGPGKYIAALVPVNGEDYSSLLMGVGQPLTVIDLNGEQVTYDPSAPKQAPRELTPAEQRVRDLANKMKTAVGKAVEAYGVANGGARPPNGQALIPYFATPQEGADFVEILEAQKAAAGK